MKLDEFVSTLLKVLQEIEPEEAERTLVQVLVKPPKDEYGRTLQPQWADAIGVERATFWDADSGPSRVLTILAQPTPRSTL